MFTQPALTVGMHRHHEILTIKRTVQLVQRQQVCTHIVHVVTNILTTQNMELVFLTSDTFCRSALRRLRSAAKLSAPAGAESSLKSALAGLASSSMPSGTGDGGFGGPTCARQTVREFLIQRSWRRQA